MGVPRGATWQAARHRKRRHTPAAVCEDHTVQTTAGGYWTVCDACVCVCVCV